MPVVSVEIPETATRVRANWWRVVSTLNFRSFHNIVARW